MRFVRLVFASPFVVAGFAFFIVGGLIVIVSAFIMGKSYAKDMVRALAKKASIEIE